MSGRPFGAFAVLRPQSKVIVKYTDFSDGGQAQINGTLFTGGFAVHEGDLELEHCTFENMKSEDGLNLKNGHIIMRNCVFTANDSDAVDLDFVTGIVENCEFRDIGGDGLDISGSTIEAADCRFMRVADKGFSVGEKSSPTIYNSLFSQCDIGISAKDLSVARVAHCTFVDNRLAIEAKRKKPMFGGGSGDVVNCVFAGNQVLMTEDYFSQGKMQVSHSLTDIAVDWPASAKAEIRFADKQRNDFELVTPVNDMQFSLASPIWLRLPNHASANRPGIYSKATMIGSR